jgi:DNA-binding transcriptional regulator GbsR (MarR family)
MVEPEMPEPDAPERASSHAPSGTPASLEELQERFVLHWGEMASAWGIPRTMGQIHALLYINPEPLATDEIMLRLRISRGNASMSLRSLEDWGVIQRVHYRGERREYFQSLTDVWDLGHTILQERKRREFDPLLRSLRQFQTDAEAGLNRSRPAAGEGTAAERGLAHYRERIGNLLRVLDVVQTACDRFLPRDPRDLPRLLEVNVRGLEIEGLDFDEEP